MASMASKLAPKARHGIPLADWLAVIESDDSVSCIVDEGDTVSALFQTHDASNREVSEEIIWCNGSASACQPSDQLIVKLMSLARRLKAELVSASVIDSDLICEGNAIVATAGQHDVAPHRMTIFA